MRSILTHVDYTSPDVLATEEARIFRRLWILVGFNALVASPDSFITHRIGGVPIVVQNTAKGLKAFVNQCAHRQSPIQLADFGQRRMACPYHGWVYDSEGRVKSVPGNDDLYKFELATLANLGLRPIALRVVGGLVFVNLDDNPSPLESQLHQAFIDRIEEVSSYVGDDAVFAKFDANYNWKLNFENVMDGNHVPFVHSKSFAPLMSSGRPIRLTSPGDASSSVSDTAVEGDIRELSYETRAEFDFRPWPWHESIERCGDRREYINLFIYPNVNYIVMAGAVHLIQQFCPLTPGATQVRLTMALGRRTRRLPAAPAILWSELKSEKRVIDEDIAVLEGVQRGLHTSSEGQFHGQYEYRLQRVAKIYRQLLGAP